jgi:site-specific DNA-methyltransferase (adenine-specific)
VERAIIAAFLVANRGFSTDRVIADPELNAAFVAQCQGFGAPGNPVVWNRALLGIRKAKKLTAVHTTRRTHFSAEELDSYLFASEIAVRIMMNEKGSATLDDILCDPRQAQEFDKIAQSFAPGFSPLRYRWAALTIRKRASRCREDYSTRIPIDCKQRRPRFCPITEIGIDRIKSHAGVYLMRDPTRQLYAGETIDLGARIRRKREEALEAWRSISKEIELASVPLADAEPWLLRGFQSSLIERHQPELNFLELGVA